MLYTKIVINDFDWFCCAREVIYLFDWRKVHSSVKTKRGKKNIEGNGKNIEKTTIIEFYQDVINT